MELMTALNRLHGGKNIKLPYFIAQLSRYAVPKVLLRSRLEEIQYFRWNQYCDL